MKFRGFISIETTLPRNKSRFYYKSTLRKFRKLFQTDIEFTIQPSYVRVFQIAFLLPHVFSIYKTEPYKKILNHIESQIIAEHLFLFKFKK